jgi:hypothetical protein
VKPTQKQEWSFTLGHMTDEALMELAELIEVEWVKRDVCQHGITSGEYCEPCNKEYKRAAIEAGDQA